MRLVILVAYVAMAAWLLVAAAIRIALLLNAGLALDALPFIGGALGLIALLILVPAMEEAQQRDPKHDPADQGGSA